MPRVLLVDHYDSFTHNLYQQLASLGAMVEIVQHDQVSLDDIHATSFDGIVLSPGPGKPQDAVVTPHIVTAYASKCPILGVCLGMQVIGKVYGVETVYAPCMMHGKTSEIHHNGTDLFEGIDTPFLAARYHSLVISDVPSGFHRTAWTDDGVLMGIAHDELAIFGVQFHPESFLTDDGDTLMKHFLRMCHA